jgi:SAM-dependent methyltransferase
MTGAYDWRGDIGDVWAQEWRRTDRTLAPVNLALIAEAAASAGAGTRILDIGCGAGATSLALADALGGAEVTGIDLSQALIAVARERAGDRGGRVRFEVGDAASWSPADAGFDLIVSRHGVMFFDDPVGAFTHICALARPGARLVFSCFRDRRDNGWVRAIRPLFERFAPEALAAPDPPAGPFAFADPARIEGILREAGFAAPRIVPFDFEFVVGAGEDPIADAVGYFRRVGPFAALLRTLEPAAGEAATDLLASIAAEHEADGRVVFGAAAWIVTSVRP